MKQFEQQGFVSRLKIDILEVFKMILFHQVKCYDSSFSLKYKSGLIEGIL